MDRTASQLSYEGIVALHETARERELAVFFRNSHFSTVLKRDGELYLLCTDIAFATSHIVWERLDEMNGDTTYCDAEFRANTAGDDDQAALAAAEAYQVNLLECGEAVDPDAALALRLMQEDLQAQQQQQQQQHRPQQQNRRQQDVPPSS